MLRLEQMTDGKRTVYRMEFKSDVVSIVKYFQDIDKGTELDETQLKSVENGLQIEIK